MVSIGAFLNVTLEEMLFIVYRLSLLRLTVTGTLYFRPLPSVSGSFLFLRQTPALALCLLHIWEPWDVVLLALSTKTESSCSAFMRDSQVQHFRIPLRVMVPVLYAAKNVFKLQSLHDGKM